MMWGHWDAGGPGYFGMGLGMLLFWGLVIVAVVVVVRWLTGRRAPDTDASPRQAALDILAQRYARGEIERAEYEQKRRDLQGP